MYETAKNIFVDNLFFGVGPKNFKYVCKEDDYYKSTSSCNNHPHNTYIQLLSETGLIGFIFVFGFFLIIVLKCILHFYLQFFKRYLFNDFEICLLSSILISLWPFIPTGDFFNNWINIIYFFPCGFLLWSFDKKHKI